MNENNTSFFFQSAGSFMIISLSLLTVLMKATSLVFLQMNLWTEVTQSSHQSGSWQPWWPSWSYSTVQVPVSVWRVFVWASSPSQATPCSASPWSDSSRGCSSWWWEFRSKRSCPKVTQLPESHRAVSQAVYFTKAYLQVGESLFLAWYNICWDSAHKWGWGFTSGSSGFSAQRYHILGIVRKAPSLPIICSCLFLQLLLQVAAAPTSSSVGFLTCPTATPHLEFLLPLNIGCSPSPPTLEGPSPTSVSLEFAHRTTLATLLHRTDFSWRFSDNGGELQFRADQVRDSEPTTRHSRFIGKDLTDHLLP